MIEIFLGTSSEALYARLLCLSLVICIAFTVNLWNVKIEKAFKFWYTLINVILYTGLCLGVIYHPILVVMAGLLMFRHASHIATLKGMFHKTWIPKELRVNSLAFVYGKQTIVDMKLLALLSAIGCIYALGWYELGKPAAVGIALLFMITAMIAYPLKNQLSPESIRDKLKSFQ